MWWFLIIGLAVAAAGVLWVFWKRRSPDRFIKQVQRSLAELNLVVHRLPDRAIRELVFQSEAIRRTDEGASPRSAAMVFFLWYCTKFKPIDPRVFSQDGAIGLSIPTLRRWASEDKRIADRADVIISKLVQFLHDGFERSGMPKEEILVAQMNLLALAAGRQPVGIDDFADVARDYEARDR